MAIVLMGIVSIFLVCNSFRIFLNFYEAVYVINSLGNDGSREPLKDDWFFNASIISNLFVTLNACSNLIIYCAMNNQFRNHFFETIPFCKLPFVSAGIETMQSKIEDDTLAITAEPNISKKTETTELRETNGNQNIEVAEASIVMDGCQKTNDVNGKEDFV